MTLPCDEMKLILTARDDSILGNVPSFILTLKGQRGDCLIISETTA